MKHCAVSTTLLVSSIMANLVASQETTTTLTCADLTGVSCQACVGAACGFDATGQCLESCDDASAAISCFSTQNFVGLSAVEICGIARTDDEEEDASEELGGPPPPSMMEEPSGGSTTTTTATFPETTVGGSETLDIDCAAFADTTGEPTCQDCLEAGCVYTQTQQCLSSCMFIADAACWDLSESGVGAIAGICQAAEDLQVDAELCGGKI